MIIDDFRILFRKQLSGHTEPEEVENLCFITLQHVLGMSRVEISLSRKQKLSNTQSKALTEILSRLEKSEPIQYITGSTEFYGLEFKVNPATLIPRPETEELVEWMITSIGEIESNSTLNILDIGTGSGCIAISIVKNLKSSKVSAIDISSEALKTASQNAMSNQVDIAFIEKDILQTKKLESYYDIIVSNPPYVRDLEKAEMRANVLNNEPESALFVPDEDPLLFYRKIGNLAFKNLQDSGMLFFEINEYLGEETVTLLKKIGFKDVILRKDMFGKDRMIRANR